jgi:hypothetical protein
MAEKTCLRCCPTCTQTKACSVHCMAYNHPQGACQPVPPNPFQELAKEFRRLAAEAETAPTALQTYDQAWAQAEAWAFKRAAQMLEEKLNG